MADAELEEFLKRADEIGGIIKDLSSSEKPMGETLKKADAMIEEMEPKGKDRMVINKKPDVIGEPLPEGVSGEQASMMRGLEQDAHERAERRKVKMAQSEALKKEGNEEFKAENYDAAIVKYREAIRLDPGNALLYTNSAQASLKLGDYDAALERCDVAIRADERCVKAHLRRGIALRSMGEYGEAIESFKTARKLVPADKRKPYDRHIQETKVTQKIAESESELAVEVKSGSDGAAFKVIERGASKMSLPALKPAEYLATAGELLRTIKRPMHQDLFRLRKGTRLLADSTPCKGYVAKLKDPAAAGSAVAEVIERVTLRADNGTEVIDAACTIGTLRLMAVAAKSNEASCRDLFKAGPKDVKLFTSLLSDGIEVREACVSVLRVVFGQSPFVRRLVAQDSGQPLVHAIFSTIGASTKATALRREACICYGLLAAEEAFRKRCSDGFGSEILPKLLSLLSVDMGLAEAALIAMNNFSADDSMRRRMAQEDSMSEFFLSAHHWSRILLDANPEGDEAQDKAIALYSLLGLVQNVALEPAACTYLQQQPILDCIVAQLDIMVENVYSRSAMLLARICTVKLVAERLIAHGGMQTMIELAESIPDDADFLNAVARTAVKLVQLYPAARTIVACERCLQVWRALLFHSDEKVVGNAALCISECCRDQQVCMDLVGTTVVADLLQLARKSKSKMTENCAIALARLASGHPEHKARLRQLGGFEVLHSRAPKQGL